MIKNNSPSPFIGVSVRGANHGKRFRNSAHNHDITRDYVESILQKEISESVRNEVSSRGISPISSEVDQVVLEDECTKILKRMVDYCNSTYFVNFKYRLIMEVYED